MWWMRDDDTDEAGRKERRMSNWTVFRRLLPYFGQQRRILGVGLGLLVVITLASLAGPQILRLVLNQALERGQETVILWLAGGFLAVVLLGVGLNFLLTILVTRAGLEIVTGLKARLFRHVMALPLTFFADYTPGKLLSRVEGDTENLKQLFSHAAIRLFHSLFIFVGIIIVMAIEDLWTTLAVCALFPILIGITFLFLRLVRRYFRGARRAHAKVAGYLTEYVRGVGVVQHYRYEPRAARRMADLNQEKQRVESVGDFIQYGFWGFFDLFEILAIVVVIAVGAGKVIRGDMDLGTLVMFVEYLRQVFMPILMMSEFLNFVQRAFVSAERVLGILDLEADEQQVPIGSGLHKPLTEGIRFQEVRFKYGPDAPEVLTDISFFIGRGEQVALVGPSGSGKTTLAKLLLQFYRLNGGCVTVDGVDLATLPKRSWRRRVGLVLQGIHLFPGTLRENLTVFDPEVTDEQLWRALHIVQAGPVVEQLPDGLDTVLAERGANLSQGERQLLSFARALVNDPQILVLDEATASVDPQTERLIQESMARMLKGRTALIIAHRLSTVQHADRIVVLEDGGVMEQGSHQQLMAQSGRYRHLVELQLRDGEALQSSRAGGHHVG